MDLAQHLASAARVVVVSGSTYDSRRRRNNEVLGQTDAPKAVERLVMALAVGGEEGSDALMMTGHPTLGLHDEAGEFLTAVGVLGTSHLRWSGWQFDRPLQDPEALATWLREHAAL